MEAIHYLQLLGGLVLLLVGAEGLVRGASRLAAHFGLSPLVIGLTIVALGTSSPEIAVSVAAAATGKADVTLGNVIGSNVANILLILGIAAVITPLIVAQRLVRIEVPIMIGAAILIVLMSLDGRLGRIDGVILTIALLAYIAFQFKQARSEPPHVEQQYEKEFGIKEPSGRRQLAIDIVMLAAGLAVMVFGSRWLVSGASEAARVLGLSEFLIGITIVAIGTSLPEVATSVLAAMKGQRDIAVGNVIGSNIFNTFGVLGLSSLAATGSGLEVHRSILQFDLPIMVAITVACLPIFFNGYRVSRWEGIVFLGYYAAYLLYLVLAATDHDASEPFNFVMLWFVIPITVLTLAIVTLRNYRRSRWKKSATSQTTVKD
ncbi:MAG: calcium/sodium antiporter [Chloroflexi bacterium]|nr:calcium/sodium antiporter [Chloroflexota bacterium]